MSLYSSIRMASNTIQADSIALQVVGQNIANANTPGYIREEVLLSPGPTQRLGGLLLGTGVQVLAVQQKIDTFLEERLRGAVSDQFSAEAQEETYLQLEGVIGELNDTDLSTAMNRFFGSINEILNQPESTSVRNLAMLQGKSLTEDIGRLAKRVGEMRFDINQRVTNMASDLNRLLEEVRRLNIRIAETEVGGASTSDAVGLRDKRLEALEDLAELIDIRVQEQDSGAVVVYAGGDWLVYEGSARQVEVVLDNDRGMAISSIHITDVDAPLELQAGQLHGLTTARDEILGGYLDRLNDFAQTLIFEFNKLYSKGQGLNGYQEVTSEFPVDDNKVPLNSAEAGLAFTPVNGSFQVMVYNKKTGLSKTADVLVDLNGMGDDMSLEGLRDAINATGVGVTATVTPTGKITIKNDAVDQEFAFAGDTSGILAALGINTFFSGTSATDIAVNRDVRNDPAKFVASFGGIGYDTDIAIEMAAFLDRPLSSQSGQTLSVVYDRMIGETTQGSTVAGATAEGARVFQQTLRGQKLAISGVSLDEEAVKMIAYQHSFQASARYIQTLTELLNTLVNL
ncbi:MAG: flagellar hook-associated protein FlgK [Rhodopirellula sp.]|nr:flagellar hook-associated protein FlgK [Rhodopirellula sp.]